MPVHYVYGIIIAVLSILMVTLTTVMYTSRNHWSALPFLGGFVLMDGILVAEATHGWFMRISSVFVGWPDWPATTLIIVGFVVIVVGVVMAVIMKGYEVQTVRMAHTKR